LKDHGSHAGIGQGEDGNDENNKGADLKIHGVWQGN